MAESVVLPQEMDMVAKRTSAGKLLAGVALMSFASLLLELSLTRLFSVVLFYHFAFLAISIALLGLGAGGVFAYLLKQRLESWTVSRLGVRVCALNALLMLVVLEIDLRTPVQLQLTSGNFLRLTIIYLVSALPFFLTGLLFSVVFARHTDNISRLYAADLGGGSLACLAIVGLLNVAGGPNTVLFAAVAFAAAAMLWAETPAEKRGTSFLTVALLALIAVNYSGKLVDIVYAKGMRRDKSWVEYARWNAISRVEVDNQGSAKVIVIDADASTYIMAQDPKQQWEGSAYQQNLMSAAPSVTNVLRPHGKYAIIGPGGGVDVLRAIANGSPDVTGIEINPIIVNNIMRGRYADYSYGLYERPNVHIHVSDGRSWVRNASDRFDVVQMTLVDTWASTAAGAFALSENNLYTVEAFREYFAHLAPDGYIAITRWEFKQPREALRVVAQAMRALCGDASTCNLRRNFIIVSDGALTEDGRPVTVLAKKTAFTDDEELALTEHLARHSNLQAMYLPSAAAMGGAEPAGAAPFRELIYSQQPEQFAAKYAYNVAPVYDGAPFFFFTLKPSQLLHSKTEAGIDWKVNMGVLVLLMLLAISAVAVLVFLVLPLALRPGAGMSDRALPLLYFVAIGLGYIAVEITLIQRLVLFLGHPIYALTVVVFLMLLSSGVGSVTSRRMLQDPLSVRAVLFIVVAALVFYVWALPHLLYALVGLPFAAKLLMSALFIVPVGFAMGMPFPSGLRAIGGGSESMVEWAWAMNAASTVLGSVLAMVIAIEFGLAATLTSGAAAYAIALLLTGSLRQRHAW